MKNNHQDVVRAWIFEELAHTANSSFLSDGVSLWSHTGWEIARHITGSAFCLVSNSRQKIPATICAHASLVSSLYSRSIITNNSTATKLRKLLCEPDWLWAYLCFSYRSVAGLTVKLKKQAKFRGDNILAKARDLEIPMLLESLLSYSSSCGCVAFYPDKRQENYFWGDKYITKRLSGRTRPAFRRYVGLSVLYLADVPSAAIVGSSHNEDDRWLSDLFSNSDLPYLSNPRDYFFSASDFSRRA